MATLTPRVHPEHRQVWENCPRSRGSALGGGAGPQRPGRAGDTGSPWSRASFSHPAASPRGGEARCPAGPGKAPASEAPRRFRSPPSCRKSEIRETGLLHLLRVEPRLFKETATPRDIDSADLSGQRHPETAPSTALPEGEAWVLPETGLG